MASGKAFNIEGGNRYNINYGKDNEGYLNHCLCTWASSGNFDSLESRCFTISDFLRCKASQCRRRFIMNGIFIKRWVNTLVILVTIVVSFYACNQRVNQDAKSITEKNVTLLSSMLRTKQLRIGYAGYPPYLRRDISSGEMSGYSVDLIKAILDPIGVKILWAETTWDNMKQDLILGKLDLMIEPIFMTIPRSARVGFTRPYAYFGFGAAVVKLGDERFKSIQDFNSPKITLAVTQGVASHEYATRNLLNAKLKVVPGNDITITLTEVLAGKVDAALADVPTVLEFVKVHSKDVTALFVKNPPAITPAGFMTHQEEIEFINFLNNALTYLEANGTFDVLEAKYELPSFREEKVWIPGKGLSQP